MLLVLVGRAAIRPSEVTAPGGFFRRRTGATIHDCGRAVKSDLCVYAHIIQEPSFFGPRGCAAASRPPPVRAGSVRPSSGLLDGLVGEACSRTGHAQQAGRPSRGLRPCSHKNARELTAGARSKSRRKRTAERSHFLIFEGAQVTVAEPGVQNVQPTLTAGSGCRALLGDSKSPSPPQRRSDDRLGVAGRTSRALADLCPNPPRPRQQSRTPPRPGAAGRAVRADEAEEGAGWRAR